DPPAQGARKLAAPRSHQAPAIGTVCVLFVARLGLGINRTGTLRGGELVSRRLGSFPSGIEPTIAVDQLGALVWQWDGRGVRIRVRTDGNRGYLERPGDGSDASLPGRECGSAHRRPSRLERIQAVLHIMRRSRAARTHRGLARLDPIRSRPDERSGD